MSFPKRRAQMNGLPIRSDGRGLIPAGAQRNAEVVISIRVRRIASQRLIESMHRGRILSIGIKSEAEEPICLGVLGIDAEGGAGFRDRIRTIIQTIENVR